MTNEDFIKAIRHAVYDSSIDGVIHVIEKPPGRQPLPGLVALSTWFNQLPHREQERIHEVIRVTARQAVFGMLAVLDGVRSIMDPKENGRLELRHVSQSESVLLNDPSHDALHDIFAAQVPLQ